MPNIRIGQKFGRWAVLSLQIIRSLSGQKYLDVVCECGTRRYVASWDLRSGHSRSCGCLQKDMATTHALRNHPLYATHRLMMRRCYDTTCRAYKWYGAQGIGVTQEWWDVRSFIHDILRDLGEKPSVKHQLDRVRSEGNYEPGNMRWSTAKSNCRNKRRNILVMHEGRRITLAEQAELTGVPYSTLYARIWRKKHAK